VAEPPGRVTEAPAGTRRGGGGAMRRRPVPGDLLAGFTVALVLIPQSLAYAVLAGMPPEHGLYAAAIPLLVAAPLASSPYLQTGPVALTAVLTFGALSAVAEPGSDRYVELGLLLALLVGVVRLAIGLTRAGVIAYLLSRPMLMGFVPAAAVFVTASQLPTALGAEPPAGSVLSQAAWALGHQAWSVAAILVSALVALARLGGRRLHALVPGVLVAVVAATVWSALAGYTGARVGAIDVGVPPVSLGLPWADALTLLVPGAVIAVIAVIAVVAVAEPVAIARTLAAQDRQTWDADREFVSQGAANVAAGVCGGFPIGGSFSRSAQPPGRCEHAVERRLHRAGRAGAAAAGLPARRPALRGPGRDRGDGCGPADPVRPGRAAVAPLPARRPDRRRHVRRHARVRPPDRARGAGRDPPVGRRPPVARAARRPRDVAGGRRAAHPPAGRAVVRRRRGPRGHRVDGAAGHPDAHGLRLHLDGVGRLDITAALTLRSVTDEARRAGMDVELVGVQDRDRRLVDGVVLEGRPGAG